MATSLFIMRNGYFIQTKLTKHRLRIDSLDKPRHFPDIVGHHAKKTTLSPPVLTNDPQEYYLSWARETIFKINANLPMSRFIERPKAD